MLWAQHASFGPTLCIERLVIPEYPMSARAAGIAATVSVVVTWVQAGVIKWRIESPKPHFKAAVEKALGKSKFAEKCEGASAEITFEFLLRTPRRRMFKQDVVFVPPCRFQIWANLMELNP